MKTFLRREWESTEPPESVRLDSRRRAWQRLHPAPLPVRQGNWKVVLTVAAILLMALWLGITMPFRAPFAGEQLASLPLIKKYSKIEALRSVELLPALSGQPARGREVARPARASDSLPPSELQATGRESGLSESVTPADAVIRFKLPGGSEMIWVKSANFLGDVE